MAALRAPLALRLSRTRGDQFRPPAGPRPGPHRHRCAGRQCNAQQQSQAPATDRSTPPPAAAAFAELAAAHLDCCGVDLQPCGPRGNGLVLTAAASKGNVLLRVPLSCCLAVDYESGMRLPPGPWPRLRRAVAKDDALPREILQALATLDSLAGDGSPVWERWANSVLPAPLDLTLPLAFPPRLLAELHHEAIAAGALAQQQRLAGLFPGLARSMAEEQAEGADGSGGGGVTYLQWAFACVRSRAFQLGPSLFACAPFLDLANHANDPSCNFRLSADGQCVELVALKDLSAGEEATITYSGPQGLTNQRFMAQYGFVPASNPADRLQFAALGAAGSAAAAAGEASSSGSDAEAGGQSSSSSEVLLSLDRMLDCFGQDSERLSLAMSGRDPFAYAALKSLPFAADEQQAAPLEAQLALAGRLRAELAAEAGSWPTSLEHDSALLQGWQQQQGSSVDRRLAAAVEYRLKRKALVTTCSGLLGEFVGVTNR